MEDWAEIRRLHRAEGMAIRAIARRLGISRNTVKKALPPRYVRASVGSIVDAVEPHIRALLAEFPDMPTSVIMERVGWARGKTVFVERVTKLRPLFRPPDQASRTGYQPRGTGPVRSVVPSADVPLGWGQVGRPATVRGPGPDSRTGAHAAIPDGRCPMARNTSSDVFGRGTTWKPSLGWSSSWPSRSSWRSASSSLEADRVLPGWRPLRAPQAAGRTERGKHAQPGGQHLPDDNNPYRAARPARPGGGVRHAPPRRAGGD